MPRPSCSMCCGRSTRARTAAQSEGYDGSRVGGARRNLPSRPLRTFGAAPFALWGRGRARSEGAARGMAGRERWAVGQVSALAEALVAAQAELPCVLGKD